MEIFSHFLFITLIIVSLSLVQTAVVTKQLNGDGDAETGPVGFRPKNFGANEDELTTTTTTTTTTTPEPPIQATNCPAASTISPCVCRIVSFVGISVECVDAAVDQATVETAFRELRRVNGIPEDRGIYIQTFGILDSSQLTQLDMAPFYGSRINQLSLMSNANLTKLVTSGNPGDYGSIQVRWFDLWYSPINRAGFGDTLKYFSKELMTNFHAISLDLNDNDDDDNSSSESKFLPELSAFTNLKVLRLSDSDIRRLTSHSWNFQRLEKLETLNLYENKMTEIGEHVFQIESEYLYIDLLLNNLNESSFHPNSGITQPGRKTILDLVRNQITTLPAQIFQAFLDAHPENALDLGQNPLICDERLSWLKSRRDEFQFRVNRTECINDLGHTVFDSQLIP